jgi:heavy metal sensor kinase
MLKSIRLTLQLWHAGILLLALASFGAALYYGTSRSRFKEADTELQGAAQVLAARFAGPPPRPWPAPPDGRPEVDAGRPPRAGGPPPRLDDRPPPRPRFDGDGPPDGPPPFDGGPPDRRGPPRGYVDLPPNIERRFGGGEEGGYYIVWTPQGDVRQSSQPPPDVVRPAAAPRTSGRPGPPVFRCRGALREVILTSPQGGQILVGRSIQREINELRQLAWLLASIGLAVMSVGLAGGWILSRQAVKPIAAMTDAARAISVTNLSRRIDVSGTRNELTQLATVLNATFDRLQAAFAQQVRFSADASHELRTPISVIHSQAELALSRERSSEEYRQTIEACLRAARRMKALADSLLILARADAGRLELANEPFDLRQTAEECLEMIRPLAEQKNIAIHADLQAAPIVGDRFRLAQVLTNLLTNAVHYNREGGNITLIVLGSDRETVVEVADTGSGISAEDRPHIFQRFYRGDKTRSRQSGGSGLGLAICKSIIEAHGGSISFESTPDQGTRFVVRLSRIRKIS